jgi:hypothetical protein
MKTFLLLVRRLVVNTARYAWRDKVNLGVWLLTILFLVLLLITKDWRCGGMLLINVGFIHKCILKEGSDADRIRELEKMLGG